MITVRFEVCCAKFLSSRYFDTVLSCDSGNSHAAQVAGQRVNPVRFFDAQLGGVTHDQTFFTNCPEHCQYWNLIDDSSRDRILDDSAAYTRRFDLEIPNQLPVYLFNME